MLSTQLLLVIVKCIRAHFVAKKTTKATGFAMKEVNRNPVTVYNIQKLFPSWAQKTFSSHLILPLPQFVFRPLLL